MFLNENVLYLNLQILGFGIRDNDIFINTCGSLIFSVSLYDIKAV